MIKDKIITILHNKEKAPYLGSRFGQDVEPSGYYCIKKDADFIPINWEEKDVILKNPLMISVNSDNLVAWKYELFDKLGLKGKRLSKYLQRKGYDSIVTIYGDGGTGEIIIFDITKNEI